MVIKGKAPRMEVVQAQHGKKTCVVVGAGASGLAVMKELTALHHSVTCFDENVRIGGVYCSSYDRTMLTTSSLLTAYSDYSDGLEDRPVFWTDEQYLDYLDGFANAFSLYDHINFRSSVQKITKCCKTGKWLVTVRQGGAHVAPHRSTFLLGRHVQDAQRCLAKKEGALTLQAFYAQCEKEGFPHVKGSYAYDYFDHVTGERRRMAPQAPFEEVTYCVDHVAICTGTNHWASLPRFEGQDLFIENGGTLVHSENYKKPEVFRGKRVLVVGAGESGSDITNEISNEALKVAIVVRGKHGHLIPRKQADGRVTDLNTNRCRYSNPYVLGDWVGYVNQLAKKFVAKHSSTKPSDERKILHRIGELNLEQGTSAFSKFGCKNEGFVTAMVCKGAELHRDAFKLAKGKAVFKDGSTFECDSVVACTGYRNSFPMFEHEDVRDVVICPACGCRTKDLNAFGQNPRRLYKQIFVPVFPDGQVAFFGFARPAFGSVPPTAEMQAKYFALVVDGRITLPDTKCMEHQALKDQANWEWRFGYDAKRVKGLVDFQLYTDDLAERMGCLPPLMMLFLTKPRIWWKIMFGPFTMHQYLLRGPFADPQRAALVYSKQPVGDFLECSITAAFLLTAKVLALCGFLDFQPNYGKAARA